MRIAEGLLIDDALLVGDASRRDPGPAAADVFKVSFGSVANVHRSALAEQLLRKEGWSAARFFLNQRLSCWNRLWKRSQSPASIKAREQQLCSCEAMMLHRPHRHAQCAVCSGRADVDRREPYVWKLPPHAGALVAGRQPDRRQQLRAARPSGSWWADQFDRWISSGFSSCSVPGDAHACRGMFDEHAHGHASVAMIPVTLTNGLDRDGGREECSDIITVF